MTETYSVIIQEYNGEAQEGKRKSNAEEVLHSDDESATDLFDSLMEIANDPSLRDEAESNTKVDGDVGTEGQGVVTELAQNNEIVDLVTKNGKEIKTVDADNCEDQTVSSTATAQSSGSSGNDKEQSSGTEKSGDKCESNVGVRLSKAVDDLDGLQQQLSSMMASFQNQPSETVNVEEKEGTEEKSEVSSLLENGESSNQETEEEIKAADNVVSSEEQQSNESDEKQEASSATLETLEKPSPENGNSKADEMVIETESTPCLLEEQVSRSDSLQNNCDKKETVDKQPVNEEAGEEDKMTSRVEIVEIENDAENTRDGAQTDKQSAESSLQEDEEVTDESSAAVEPCSADGDGVDKDVACETTPSDDKTQVDPLLINSPEISVSDAQAEMSAKDDSKNDDKAPRLANSSIISSSNAIPGIEINTADKMSSISDRKSLDSLDMDQSSHSSSQPGSPTQSDEGIDSDSRSDCGDEDTTLDPESLQRSRPKSWYLEVASRDSICSDSSVEGDTKLSPGRKYTKSSTLGEVLIRGHLLKMGGSGLGKNWKKRWFVLKKDNCLYYYKQSKDKDCLGVIVLANYSISKAMEVNKKYCFRLNKGGARTYYMCAADEGDMRKWMMALNKALRQAADMDNNSFQISESNVHNVSIPALSIRDPECHGYLSKLGQSKIKTWKRRYCVLKNGYMYYYTDMSNATALGVAQLLGYGLKKGDQQGKRFYFNAIPPEDSQRTYFFAADSEGERQRWMSRLEVSIRKGEGVISDD